MSYEPYHVTCDACGRTVDERFETVWNKVEGWEKRRDQGGTNHVAERRPLPFYRCSGCMDKALAGVNPRQESFVL